ncbi:MAG: hypothetical protein D6730_14235 [Bacteroidetes bacterium]|nr:MAG: hypothetical protein D6730_14235 [Bacteroidota bacterium]
MSCGFSYWGTNLAGSRCNIQAGLFLQNNRTPHDFASVFLLKTNGILMQGTGGRGQNAGGRMQYILHLAS